ncbi:MAG: 3-deoxy-D-manno-octulosonic acid transferase [Nitrospinales bacterium]
MLTLYHIIVNAALLAASPFVLIRMMFDSGFRGNVRRRLRGGARVPQASGYIWIHAASVGEVRAAKVLWQTLREAERSRPLVLSTFTPTGYELAKKEGFESVFLLPPDSSIWMLPLFKKLDPALLVLIEAELWPCLLGCCKRFGVPVLIASGRMSEKAFRRYEKIKGIFRKLTDPVSFFSMRTPIDAERILNLGIAKERVRVTGNIKFDALVSDIPDERAPIATDDPPLLVFGSTRPGEEGPIMETVSRLRGDFPGLEVALAPRHVNRCREVEDLIRDYGMDFIRHSELNGKNRTDRAGRDMETGDEILKPSLILLDTHGDLNAYYRRRCIAFVGGGFNPRFGGHNILEPAVYGRPVIFGNHMDNFEEEARLLAASEGGIRLAGLDELYPTLRRLLKDTEESARRGKSAAEAVQKHRGAARRNLELVERLL